MMNSSAIILHVLSLVLWVTTATGKAVPGLSTRPSKGCDKVCQRECLKVLNEYRENHDAPKLEFSQDLAGKAQKWADGGKFGYDMDARGKYGQLIEWDVKDELPTFTSVIKRWHDKEKDFDFVAGKSKNGNTLHDFTQVVWKKAHKAGCGKGKLFGSRYFVVWMDADGVLSPNGTDGSENVGRPKRADIHWFEITKIKAVGEPLYWNSTNATKPSVGQPNIRVKTSIPADDEDLNSIESEANVLNDANNIKQYVRDSLSSVLAEENREVSKLRDEFEGLDDVPNVRLGGPSQDLYDGITGENIYNDRAPGTKQIKPVAESLQWNKEIKQLPFIGRKFQKEPLKVQTNTSEKMDFQQQKVPMGKLPETVDAGQTKLSESSPTTVIHEELNISDKNTAAKVPASSPKQIKTNPTAGKRHGSESADTSQDAGKEMSGIIMGRLPDNETGNNEGQEPSNDKILRITSDKNLSPDMENELSKVSKFIDTRLKALNKNKESEGTPQRDLKNGYNTKEQGKPEDPMNWKMADEPEARPARITMVGAPLSFPERKHKDIVKDIHDKVNALWDAHLKGKKEKENKVKAHSDGEDEFSAHPYQDGSDDSLQGEGSSFSANNEFHDVDGLHGYQYTAGNDHHQETYPENYDHDNPMSSPQPNKMPLNHGSTFNGYLPPIRLHPEGDWFGGPAVPNVPPVSPAFDDPITHAMKTGPGGLYEYRKKYTSEEPEKETERFLHRKKNSLQSVVDVFEDKEGSVEPAYSDNEKEPVLQPIKLPKKEASVGSETSSFKNTESKPQDHKDLLALPKELTARPDNEMTVASQLPDLISDTLSTSITNSEENDHPGYFNEEPGLNRPIFVGQNSNQYQRRPTSNNSPRLHYQTRPGYGYTQPQNTPIMRSQAGYPSYPYGYSQPYQYNPMQAVGLPQGINQGYGYGQQQEPIQSVQDLTYNPGYGYPQQSQVQGSTPSMPSMPSMPQVAGTSNGDAPKPTQPQKILKGVSLPSSMGVVTDNEAQQSALTLSDKNDKSPKKPSGTEKIDNAPLTPSLPEEQPDEMKVKGSGSDSKGPKNNAGGTMNLPQNSLPQQGQGGDSGPQGGSSGMPQSQPQNGVPQDGSSNGATVTVDGKPVKGPYKSSGVYTVKGPFVYQTDTTIIMGGPQNSGGSKPKPIPMNGGGSPSQVPNSNPQNAPPSVDNTNGQQNKQDTENPNNGGNQPELSKRPSLITLLKEAEMNKQKQSESKDNKGKSDKNKESENEGSTSSGEQPESSGESKKPPSEQGENEKPPSAPTENEKEKEGSSENEKQPSVAGEEQKGQQGPTEETKPGESSENKEQSVETSQEGSTDSSGEKEKQKESQSKEKPNNQLKIETEANGPEGNENTQESKESEKQPSGPTSNENQSGGSTANEKRPIPPIHPPAGSMGTGNLPTGLPGNEKPPSGSSENEKQPSGSSENEKQPTGSSENEKQPTGSSENEKQPSSSSKKPPTGSIDSSGSSDNQKPPTGSIDPSGSAENENQPSGPSDNQKPPSGSSENGNQPSGSIDPSSSQGNEKQPSGTSENEKQPSGSKDPSSSQSKGKQPSGSSENGIKQGGSIDPSSSQSNEKQSSGSSENENPPSGSKDPSSSQSNEKQPSGSSENGINQGGSIDPSSSQSNEKQPSGPSENENPPSGSIDPSRSQGSEKRPSGPSENEKQPSGSKDPSSSQSNEKPSGPSENENPPSGSKDPSSSQSNEKPSGPSENENPPSGSKDPSSSQGNEKQPSGPSENEKQPSGSKDPSSSQSNEKQPSGSSENGIQQGGSIDPSKSSGNEQKSSGSSENEKQSSGSKSGSSDNEKQQSGPSENENQPIISIDPSGPPKNEKEPSDSSEKEKQQSGSIDPSSSPGGSSDNENHQSGSSDNQKQPMGSIDPSDSKGNKDESNGNEDQPTNSIEIKEPLQNNHQQNIFLTKPEVFKDKSQASKEGGEGVSIYKKPFSDLPKGAHYEPAIKAQHPLSGAATGEGPIQDHHHAAHSENQTEHSKQMKAKLLLPFTRLIANINHALGLDAPNSTMKINHIALSSKHPSEKTSQAVEPGSGKNVEPSQETSTQGSTEKAASHHPIEVDVPEGNTVSGAGEALKHAPEHHQDQNQDIRVDKPELPTAQHGGVGTLLSAQEHRPATETLTASAITSGIHHLSGGERVDTTNEQDGHTLMPEQQGRLHAAPTLQKQLLRPSGSVTDMVDESHSAGASHVQEINENPIVEVTNPGSCKDEGERCSLWQKRGHCRSVLYAGFMKRHCKATCGYCALPSIVIQSERANAGIKFAYGEHTCQDSSTYEFSCPTWKAQGYCQKKEQEMRRFCSSTCNFCKRKKVPKKKKKATDKSEHDQSEKDTPSQSGNTSTQPQSYANAQTGQGNGAANAQAGNYAGQQQQQQKQQQQQQPNYAHAQVGKPSEPQSTAHASGGNTYVQTQSSGGQQTGYAVASAAASPEQQTYAQAQSSSQSGRPSTAYAQNRPSSNNKSSQSTAHAQTGSPEKPENVAHAQTSPVNDDPKQSSKPKNRDEGKVAEASNTRLHGMSIDERVMSESPEYKAMSTDYYIKAGNEDETAASELNLYDEPPPIRFSSENPEKPTNGYGGTEGNSEPGLEQNQESEQGSSDDAETKAGYVKDDLKDMEVKDTEDEKVQMLMNKFDPVMADEQDDDLAKSKISTRTPDKKGRLDFVSTEGCDQSCQRECLDAINSYRRNHKVRSLVLDQDLAEHAQQWADSKTYGHSSWAQQGMGGELIAVGSFYKTFTAAVKAWHDEEKDFDWEKGKLKKGKEIKHFKQLISKDAHVLGCGKSVVNGEPYYVAQMDAAESMDNEKRETMERPVKPDLGWYMESSPYWKDLQNRERIPKHVQRNLF